MAHDFLGNELSVGNEANYIADIVRIYDRIVRICDRRKP